MNPDLVFTYNEVYGPFDCETPGCTNDEAWSIIISDEENKLLPQGDRFERSNFVFKNNLGTAICDDCLAKKL
jgi:hypothetical protein